MFCTSCIDYCLVESHTCPLCRATNNQLPPESAELDFLTAGEQIEAAGLQYFGEAKTLKLSSGAIAISQIIA